MHEYMNTDVHVYACMLCQYIDLTGAKVNVSGSHKRQGETNLSVPSKHDRSGSEMQRKLYMWAKGYIIQEIDHPLHFAWNKNLICTVH